MNYLTSMNLGFSSISANKFLHYTVSTASIIVVITPVKLLVDVAIVLLIKFSLFLVPLNKVSSSKKLKYFSYSLG